MDKKYYEKNLKIKMNMNYNDYIDYSKIKIWKLKNFIPLYDIKTKNIYLIQWKNVFFRITKCNYRYLDENILNMFMDVYDKILKKDKSVILDDNKEMYDIYKEK